MPSPTIWISRCSRETMKAIHLANAARRDAQVAVERRVQKSDLQTVLPNGEEKVLRRMIKNTVRTEWSALLEQYGGDAAALERALRDENPEVDFEVSGRFLARSRRLYVTCDNSIAYRLNLYQIVRDAAGNETQRRDVNKVPANIDGEKPLVWTGRRFPKAEAVRRFVFARSYQLRHINGVTFDFLFHMARELASSNELMLIGGGARGTLPVILTRGGQPYRGFLEGRVENGCYLLILHLSDIELKQLRTP